MQNVARFVCALGMAVFLIATGCQIARSAEFGKASYYTAGVRRADGQPMNGSVMGCAHRSLPMHSHARVTNLENGRAIVCQINDRGPFIRGRVVDVTIAAARQLGMIGAGVVRVRVDPLS